MKSVLAVCMCVAVVLMIGSVNADECTTAQSLVNKAIDHYKSVGKDKSFADFMNKENKEWVNGGMYVSVSTMEGIFKVEPLYPKLIDNPKVLTLKDVNGVMYVQEMVRVGKETPAGDWVKYTWTHPETRKLAPKQVWVKVHDGMLFSVGCYP